MEMLNRAIEDAADYRGMMEKIIDKREREIQAVAMARHVDPEITAWNAEVERKRAEKKARKTQHTKALDGLR